MRFVIASTSPLSLELGAPQVFMSLAGSLRGLGHDVRLWAPERLPPGHRTIALVRLREQWRSFVRTMEPVDVVDCPPLFAGVRPPGDRARWVCRSTQPDLLYAWESLGAAPGRWPASTAREAVQLAFMGALAGAFQAGWRAADIITCHTEGECRRIARWSPWLESKLTTFDGALAERNRSALDAVRRARTRPLADGPIRYIWIGRWTAHKGTRRLLEFLSSRLGESRDEFTVAGCGLDGVAALAHLGSGGRLRVVPSYTRAELPGLLAQHDAGLFTSRAEGWGLVLNEMIEAGLPVYATDAGGVEELRKVLPSSLPAFPPPVRPMLPEPSAEDVFARYRERFSWDRVTARYLESLGVPP